MSYKCAGCQAHVEGSRLLYTKHRQVPNGFKDGKPVTRTEVASEHPVCPICLKRLTNGASLKSLQPAPTVKIKKQIVAPVPLETAEVSFGEFFKEQESK